MLRVVGDTNFWIAVAGWHGLAHKLYLMLRKGQFVHLTTVQILTEIGHSLRYLPHVTDDMAYEWYCTIGMYSQVMSLSLSVVEHINVCRDPDDNKFLECALWGQADILISRDKDLLVLDGYRGLRIQRPEALWSLLEQV